MPRVRARSSLGSGAVTVDAITNTARAPVTIQARRGRRPRSDTDRDLDGAAPTGGQRPDAAGGRDQATGPQKPDPGRGVQAEENPGGVDVDQSQVKVTTDSRM